MMFDRDSKLIFEAYREKLITELSPLSLTGGEGWDFSEDQRSAERSFPLLDTEAISRVVDHVISLFPVDGGGNPIELDIGEKHERKGKKSVSMWLRQQVQEFVARDRGEVEGEMYPNKTDVRYNSRVIANDMLDDSAGDPFISITPRGTATVDLDRAEDVKGEIEDDLSSPPPSDVEDVSRKEAEPRRGGIFKDNVEYTADATAIPQLDPVEQEMLEYFQDGMTGADFKEVMATSIPFRELVAMEPGKFAHILNKFVQSGILTPVVETGDLTDVAGDIEPENPAYAAQDYWQRELGGHGMGSGSMSDH
jgi:hypothetical protein